jgi:hypothetical protein
MANSANLGLPYVEAAQAQKHITVNQSLVRLDAVSQLVLQSVSETTPPDEVVEGSVFAVPTGASGAWAAAAGQLAVGTNGGWDYIQPRPGWRAWISDLGALHVFDGTGWSAVTVQPEGPGLQVASLTFDHAVATGGAQATSVLIPAQSCVVGVTGRVIAAITGDATSWRLGVASSDNRYGAGFGTGLNSFMRGLTGSPLTYYDDTPLVLTPEGGDFAGGTVRLVVHMLQLDIPGPI